MLALALTPHTICQLQSTQQTKKQTTHNTTKRNKNKSAAFGRTSMKLLGGDGGYNIIKYIINLYFYIPGLNTDETR